MTTGLLILSLLFFVRLRGQSLRETLDLTLENNPHIKLQSAELEKAHLQARSAFRGTLPQIGFEASYRHATDVAEIELPGMGGVIPSRSFQLGVFDSYESGLNINYVLFKGFALQSGVRMKENLREISRTILNKSRKEIALQTIVAYRTVQNAMLELQALKAGAERSLSQLRRVRSLQEQGMALALDTLTLSLSVLNYHQKLIAAQARLETAELHLQNLAGQKIKAESFRAVELKGKLPQLQLNANEDLRGLDIRDMLLKNTLRARKAAYYPTIALQASYKYGKPGPDIVNNEWMTYGQLGIQLSWNLFRWNADRLEVQAAKTDLKKLSWRKQKARNQLNYAYEKARRELVSLKEQLKVVGAALEIARQKMEITRTQYEQGNRTAEEYASSNLEYSQAEIKQKQHILRLLLKINEIEFIAGRPISEWSIN